MRIARLLLRYSISIQKIKSLSVITLSYLKYNLALEANPVPAQHSPNSIATCLNQKPLSKMLYLRLCLRPNSDQITLGREAAGHQIKV